jgi:hypothetical protein
MFVFLECRVVMSELIRDKVLLPFNVRYILSLTYLLTNKNSLFGV